MEDADTPAPTAEPASSFEAESSARADQYAKVARAGLDNEANVHGSIVEKTVDFVEAYMQPQFGPVLIDGMTIPVTISKDGVKVLDPSAVDGWREKPRFRKGTATMFDLASFIGHVNRFKDDGTLIFANNSRQSPSISAVLDYHPEGAASEPRFGRHRTEFLFPLSDQWKTWVNSSGREMTMTDFAAFLENNITDVLPPDFIRFDESDEVVERWVKTQGGAGKIADPTKLMDLASGLTVHEEAMVGETKKLSSGEGSIVIQSRHTTTDAEGTVVIVPTMFAIAIPIFTNGVPYRIFARLRYRKSGGLKFFYELWRTDLVFDHAFSEAVETVQNETKKTVLLGTPEA